MKYTIFFITILHFCSIKLFNYVKTRIVLEIVDNPIKELHTSDKNKKDEKKKFKENIYKKKKENSFLKKIKKITTNNKKHNLDDAKSSVPVFSLKPKEKRKKNYDMKDYMLFDKLGEIEDIQNSSNIKNKLSQIKGIKNYKKRDTTYGGVLDDMHADRTYKEIHFSKNFYDNKNYDNKINDIKNSELKKDFSEQFLYNQLKNIDYSQHGNNWDVGICKSGNFQSPVDLHLQGLKERDLKNITDVYLNLFYDDDYAWTNYNKPWVKGDIFYYYEYLIEKLFINRKDNAFQIKAANEGVIPFGVLFTTDKPTMFYADQIHFHSPSEHTFQGSGNRREIEMQIFHYTNDLYEYDEENKEEKTNKINLNNKFKKDTTKKENNHHSYLISFLMNSLSNSQLEKKYSNGLRRKGKKNQYQVLSITFTSAEIDKSTIEQFKKLPSENFLRTILNAANKVTVGADPKLVKLDNALNLNSLMMMLNIENMEFLSYHGSSTLPSCAENVHWKVAKQPLPVSTELILEFYKMLKKHTPNYKGSDEDNYRHLQNVNNNIKNYGKVYLIQGFPVQVLISSALSTLEDKEVINIIKDASNKSFSNYYYLNYILFCFFVTLLKYLYN